MCPGREGGETGGKSERSFRPKREPHKRSDEEGGSVVEGVSGRGTSGGGPSEGKIWQKET